MQCNLSIKRKLVEFHELKKLCCIRFSLLEDPSLAMFIDLKEVRGAVLKFTNSIGDAYLGIPKLRQIGTTLFSLEMLS